MASISGILPALPSPAESYIVKGEPHTHAFKSFHTSANNLASLLIRMVHCAALSFRCPVWTMRCNGIGRICLEMAARL